MNRINNKMFSYDQLLLTAVLLLVIIGIVSIYSASYAIAYLEYEDSYYFLKRHAAHLIIGIFMMGILSLIDYRRLSKMSPIIMVFAVIILILAILPQTTMEINGAKRWVNLPFIPAFQPSELSKLAIIIYIAAWLSSRSDKDIVSVNGLIGFVITIATVSFLIMLEPDLGTTILITVVSGVMFFIAGARLLHVIALALSSMISLILFIVVKGYGLTRVMSFLSAESDPEGIGYQTLQLLIAFGSGGMTGLGLGTSRQKFFYLPAAHSDGILAVIGEELGFIGVALIIILFVTILVQGLRIANKSSDEFGSILATGISFMLFFQVLLNIGGISRTIPLTGIPLPMISTGGTSLIVTLASIGILFSINSRIEPERKTRKTINVEPVKLNNKLNLSRRLKWSRRA